MDDLVILLAELAAFLLILGVGGFIADYIFPHIPFIRRYLETLPQWDDEDED